MKKISMSMGLMLLTLAIKAQTVTLKFNPENGSRYDAVMKTTSKIAQTVMGQSMEINMDYDATMDYAFANAGTDRQMTIKYTKAILKMDAMGNTKNLSSEGDDEMSKPLKALKETVITATFNANGEVTHVKGFEQLAEQTTDPQGKELLKQMFSDDAMKNIIQQSMALYPPKALRIGDTWNNTIQLTTPYKMSSNNTYTLKKTENGMSYVDFISKLSSNGKQTIEAQGMQMEMSLEGSGTGTMLIDNTTGISKTTQTTQDMNATISVMGQEIPMKIHTDITVDMKKK